MSERAVITDEQYYPPLREWYENRIYPSPDGGIAVFQRYVTERKRAGEALRASSRRIANSLESITDQFYAMDREWRFTYMGRE
jgi:PAS domain-containing protein